MEVVILQGAQVDILEIYSIHGDWFYARLDLALEQIRTHPFSGPRFFQKYHRLVVPKSPFGVFYAIEGERLMVGAVLDLRQDPARIMARLQR